MYLNHHITLSSLFSQDFLKLLTLFICNVVRLFILCTQFHERLVHGYYDLLLINLIGWIVYRRSCRSRSWQILISSFMWLSSVSIGVVTVLWSSRWGFLMSLTMSVVGWAVRGLAIWSLLLLVIVRFVVRHYSSGVLALLVWKWDLRLESWFPVTREERGHIYSLWLCRGAWWAGYQDFLLFFTRFLLSVHLIVIHSNMLLSSTLIMNPLITGLTQILFTTFTEH